jgi:uncharacterized protein (TIGR02186 family)
MRRAVFIAAAAAFFLAPAPAEEELVSGLSQDAIQITSTYTGTDLTVFGAVARPPEGETNDIVVVVRGPDTSITVRRKDRIAGIWINDSSAKLDGMASYYFLAATRPLVEISADTVLGRYELGLNTLEPVRSRSDGPVTPYRNALVRRMSAHGMYTEDGGGVEMLSPTLFRVHVPLPAAAPRGQYNVSVYLFRGGTVISAQSTPLFVDQTGFERRVFAFAHHRPFAYGLFAVVMALFVGWLAAVAFRKKY